MMDRRKFIETACGAALGLGAVAATPRSIEASGNRGSLRNWAWIHGRADRTDAEWREILERLNRVSGTGALVSGGNTATLAPLLRDHGLSYHRWVWILNRAGDRWARDNHPEWFTVNRRGESSLEHPPYVGYYKWVCPTRRPVREYLANTIGEIATDPLIDGVHLDYIRHPDVILPRGLWSRYDLVQDREYPEFDFCYCEVCRDTFHSLHGTDPLDLEDPAASAEWKQFRWDSITGLVNELADVVHSLGKEITAAVFPTPFLARLMVHQQWERWNLDSVFPMTYHGFYEEDVSWIEYAARRGVEAIPAGRDLCTGLYLPSLTPEEIGPAVSHAAAGGAAGVSFFELSGFSDDHARAVEEVLGS